MSTKINQSIWGQEFTWQYAGGSNPTNALKVPMITYADVVDNDPDMLNQPYEKSTCIWGIPSDSSAGCITTLSWWSGTGKTYDFERLTPIRYDFVPTTFFYASGSSDMAYTIDRPDYITRNQYGARLSPDVDIIESSGTLSHTPYNDVTYNHQFKTTTPNASTADFSYNPNEQCVYYKYLDWIYMIRVSFALKRNADIDAKVYGGSDFENVFNSRWNTVKSNKNVNDEDIVIVGASIIPYYGSDSSRTSRANGNPILASFCECQPSTRTQGIMFGDTVDSGIQCGAISMGKFVHGIGMSATNDNQQQMGLQNAETVPPTATTYFGGQTSQYYGGKNMIVGCDNMYKFTDKHYEFDDVSYHWSVAISYNYQLYDIGDSNNWTYTLYGGYVGKMQIIPYIVIDDDKGAGYKTACQRAILHEIAFFGVPFTTSQTKAMSSSNNSADIYFPVFDNHIITTGLYKTGAQSIADGDINSTWGDVFSEESIIENYDPDYQPDHPTPTPEEGDTGYLNNKPTSQHLYGSNNRVYALTAAQYNQFINDINSLYLDDPQTGFESFQLDFKGTNPTDYIVGTYGYTFLPAGLIPNQQPESIQIGAVTLPNAEGYRIAPSYMYNYRSLGEIDLTGAGLYKPFGDFRDYEPYTHIELYVPLCGNIELDPATVVGHKIQIDMNFDIMTGNATACIYRDNQTLIATIAGQLAASLPLSAGRMGDYQNTVKTAENALKQNELKMVTSAATVAIGVGAALLTPETGGLSLAAGAAAISGMSSLANTSMQHSQIEYEIAHKQPTIAVCSAANGLVAQNISSMYAVCYIKQCVLLPSYKQDIYAHTIGHACCINTTIGEMSGLTICSNIDTAGIDATVDEINAIKQAFAKGVIV